MNITLQKLNAIKEVFDIDALIQEEITSEKINSYYSTNIFAYRLFHNTQGFVHLGLSADGVYRKKDVLGQLERIQKYISPMTTHVLELATGMGANSKYLAQKNPTINFTALDLPGGQTGKSIHGNDKNLKLMHGNYHDLHMFETHSFDIVFIIEALCHSQEKQKVFHEAYRILKLGGICIIFDGYLKKVELSSEEKTATMLAARGMMVDRFEYEDAVIQYALSEKFQLKDQEDLSLAVIPSLARFEKLASRFFFSYPRFARLLKRTLPLSFTRNALSAYLLKDLIASGVASYTMTVFEKTK
jgi:ubiquinone/menaquinone biosynthesis C-methylase UbiE